MINTVHTPDILETVKAGLSKKPKRLPSWLFYDAEGDRLFQAIMQMPGYYLTSCEYEILNSYKDELARHFSGDGSFFHLIELGAGDGTKTEILLSNFTDKNMHSRYTPVDISETVLEQLRGRLQRSVPHIETTPLHASNEKALSEFAQTTERKVFMFLGASIGNFTPDEAASFVKKISAAMHAGDKLLIGFDLKKDPRLIQAAYDDPYGITKKFNLNLLARLNREAGAQFNLQSFDHYAFYDPETGTTKSYLTSLRDQNVFFESFGECIHFERWEFIHTEISQKYDLDMITTIADNAGLEIRRIFRDARGYFCDVLFTK